jgi:hypothetical protein
MVLMVFNATTALATFNNSSDVSRRPVLFVGETVVPGENHRPASFVSLGNFKI